MAQRRMFSKEVTNSDEFLDMSLSAQALYFHLGMNADDDGFVSPKSIMRLVQAKDDDMKILIAKGFIIPFEQSVIVITHWKTNNELKKDRHKPTRYQEHLETLGLNNGKYVMYPKCIQNGNILEAQDSIGKDSIGKKDANASFSEKPLKPTTPRGWANKRREELGKPPLKTRPLTAEQKAYLKRSRCIDYFHAKSIENGYDYLNEEDDQANRKYSALAKAFEKRYRDWETQKEAIDWFFASDDLAWTGYQPNHFFSVNIWMKFDNRNSKQTKKGRGVYLD